MNKVWLLWQETRDSGGDVLIGVFGSPESAKRWVDTSYTTFVDWMEASYGEWKQVTNTQKYRMIFYIIEAEIRQ